MPVFSSAADLDTTILERIRAGRLAALDSLAQTRARGENVVTLYDGRSARYSRPVFRSQRAADQQNQTILILTDPVAA